MTTDLGQDDDWGRNDGLQDEGLGRNDNGRQNDGFADCRDDNRDGEGWDAEGYLASFLKISSAKKFSTLAWSRSISK